MTSEPLHLHTLTHTHTHTNKQTNERYHTHKTHLHTHSCIFKSQLVVENLTTTHFSVGKFILQSTDIHNNVPFNQNIIKLNIANTVSQHLLLLLITTSHFLMKTSVSVSSLIKIQFMSVCVKCIKPKTSHLSCTYTHCNNNNNNNVSFIDPLGEIHPLLLTHPIGS